MTNTQPKIYTPDPTAYGGQLRNRRRGRRGPRILSFSNTMHLVLRSTQAKGDWSFTKKANLFKIQKILQKFSELYDVKLLSKANVGNHLHFHIQFSTRKTYNKFIKAVTSAIVMAVTGASKFNKLSKAFWDQRPFTRIVFGERGRKILKNYIQINQLESLGWKRFEAIDILRGWKPQSSTG